MIDFFIIALEIYCPTPYNILHSEPRPPRYQPCMLSYDGLVTLEFGSTIREISLAIHANLHEGDAIAA